ncbi:dual specificity protein phosphatase family protein [Bradyrhizobium sp. 192]|uniref:dual specificity protein phosphatase family protein n=1 Tax=Bradyrhizobium sp. 192 TaxID=2782660 RepID=UPI001FFF7530|nr:dual specificity protein phosphatase family protein [Bradyrhizobium sp. 192]UPJ61098.1 dual specificity protein phosphatase family protein [Bradyrhizobium sp. 192]
MDRRAIKSLRLFGAAVGVVAALAGGWAGYLRLSGNFHVVDDGAVYRSGQLSGFQFSTRIRENGIRTIINLRGNNAGSPWYDDELKASDATGVSHVDFPISASRELNDQQVAQLVGLLTTSPRPILIHCEGGADRTGLASALYKLMIDKSPPSEAAAQLSFRYGHFPWFWSGTDAMDVTFARTVSHMLLTR